MVKNVKLSAVIILGVCFLYASQTVLGGATERFLEASVKSRLNVGAGNQCKSVELIKLSDDVYEGTVQFDSGDTTGIVVTVAGGAISYEFKTADEALTAPEENPQSGKTEKLAADDVELPVHKSIADDDKNSYERIIGKLELPEGIEPVGVVFWAAIFAVIICIIIAVKCTYDGKVIFFSSYLDWFISFLPFLAAVIMFACLTNTENPPDINYMHVFAGLGVFALLYNYLKSYAENSNSVFLTFCVGTGRIVIGNLIPAAIVLSWVGSPTRQRGESNSTFELRRQADKARKLVMVGAFAFFLRSLIGRSKQNQQRSMGADSYGYEIQCSADQFEISRFEQEPDSYIGDELPAQTSGKLTEEQLAMLRRQVQVPDVRPCDFDVTFDAWLHRIELWGQVSYTYHDPFKKTKRRVSKEQFLEQVYDTDSVDAFGKWGIKAKNVTTCVFFQRVLKGQ